MGPAQIRSAYMLYIGAGAVAAGGIISLLRSLPLIARGLRAGLRDFARRARRAVGATGTEHDLSMKVVVVGIRRAGRSRSCSRRRCT